MNMKYRHNILSGLLGNMKLVNTFSIRAKLSSKSAQIPSSVVSNLSIEVQPPQFSSVVLEKRLSSLGCKFEEGHVCLSVRCSSCYDDKQGAIYINKVTGFFLCMDCQQAGDWPKLEMMLKKAAPTESSDGKPETSLKKYVKKLEVLQDYSAKWNELTMSCKSVSESTVDEIKNIISSFKLQIFTDKNVLGDLDARYDEARKILYFPVTNGRKRIMGILELAQDGTQICDPFKQCPGILRYVPDRVTRKKCENVVLVTSIKDLVALSSQKHHYHVICLPHGISALPQEILPLLEQYNRIVLWFGNDQLHLNAARTFSEKLRRERCFFIKEIEERPSVYIEKTENVDVPEILKTARSTVHKYITTFANLKQEVWSALTDTDAAQGIKWQRFPALNEILRGHRRGELTILTGPTGTGKTTFLSEYSLDLAMQGVTTLWGSFEIRNQRLMHTMLQQFALVPLSENLHQFETLSNAFEKLPLYFLKFYGQEPIDVVMEAVEHATYVYDIQHLVIDNLQFMLGLSSSEDRFMDRFYKQDKVIASFRTFATVHDCHVTLIIHPKKEKESEDLTISSVFGTAKATQEADNIMIIQKKMMESLHFKKYLQIVKNRFNGDLGIMPMSFNKPLLSFGAKNLNKKPS